MPVHAVSVTIAVVQFVSYVLLSTSVQYIYYVRQAPHPEQWKSQPTKLRIVPLTAVQRTAAVAPLPDPTAAPTFTSHDASTLSPSPPSSSPTASTFSATQATTRPASSFPPSTLWQLFVCWMYPSKWLLFPSLPRVPHRHPSQSLLTTFNLTLSACVAGCVTESFMRDRSALISHTHFLPAFALPTSFLPSSSHPSLPHVMCTLLVSVVWQCVCEWDNSTHSILKRAAWPAS